MTFVAGDRKKRSRKALKAVESKPAQSGKRDLIVDIEDYSSIIIPGEVMDTLIAAYEDGLKRIW